MLLYYGLVKVLKFKAYTQGNIRFMGIGQQRYTGGWSRNRGNHAFHNHFVEGLFDLFAILYWYLPPGMLNRGKGWVSPDGVGPRHVTYSVKGVREGSL